MENSFYRSSYANKTFFEQQNKPLDAYAFQEKFFLDGYEINQSITISPSPQLTRGNSNPLEPQSFQEKQARQINEALYKEAIRETAQRILIEILFLAALYRYYKDFDFPQPNPYEASPDSEPSPYLNLNPYEYPPPPAIPYNNAHHYFGKHHIHNNHPHHQPSGLNKGMQQFHPHKWSTHGSPQNNLYKLYRWLGNDAKTFTQIEGNNIIAQARHNLGKPVWAFTRFASLCESGNLGCAATVSELLQDAGVKIPGSANVTGVVSQLNNLGWYQVKISDKQQFHSGDIVFGSNGSHAHIGIITEADNDTVLVCDNSSASGTLKERTIEAGGSFTPNGRFAGHLYVMRKENS